MAARRVAVSRSSVLRAEVKREFDEAQATDDWLWPTRYAPPWRLRYPDGEYSPWFGPSGQEALDRQLAEWRETYHAGGLWDPEEGTARGRWRRRLPDGSWSEWNEPWSQASMDLERRDAGEMHALADRYIDQLGARERDVYVLHYREGQRPRAIAASLDISVNTVRGILKGLRARIRLNKVASAR